MKIAINITREKVGGITASNINLLNYLHKHDYEFVGIELTSRMSMRGPSLFRHFSPDLFDHRIINTYHLSLSKILKKSKNLTEIKEAFAEPIEIIRQILKETKPDLLLLNGTYYFPWLISIAAQKEKIPFVLWYAGVLSKEIEHYPRRVKNVYNLMEKSLVKRAQKIIFPSTLCKNIVETEVVKHKIKNSFVVPNPVANVFTEQNAAECSLDRRIAAVGRYSKIKNFDKFFELHLELLARKWRHTASFVTNSDADLKNMPKTIEVLPPMTQKGLKAFYLSQGLIVCPSTFETFGNVPMEAACLGIPVLVSDQMGCAEILRKVGLENMIISFDDIKKVADRTKELCGQAILTKQLNALRRLLDNDFVSEEIRAIINNEK